jgi:hypothetical protein
MISSSFHRVSLTLLMSSLVFLIGIAPAMAAMTLTGAIYREDVTPGTTVTFPMMLSLGATDAPAVYQITLLGFGNGLDGRYQGIQPAEDTGPYTACPFITLDKTTVQLTPGGKEVVTATIQVPSDGAGGRYALINIHPQPAEVSGSGPVLTTAITAPILITLKGTQLSETGTIEKINSGEEGAGAPLQIQTTLKNTGNHHFYGAFVNVTMTDSAGTVVATSSSTPSIWALLPGNEMTLITPITVSLPAGTYTVKADAKMAEGMKLLDSETATITLSAPSAAVTPTVARQMTGDQIPAGGTGSTPTLQGTLPETPAETGPHKIGFLPIYVPGPDALAIVGALSAAVFVWSTGRRR